MTKKRSSAEKTTASGTRFVLVEERPARALPSGQFVVLKPARKPDSFTITELKRAVRSVVHTNAKT